MKNSVIILMLFLFFQSSWAQLELNNYKYVIVPKHFDFQIGADSYRINSLTKFLLDKKGFTTIFSDAIYPNDLKNNQCLALKANLLMHANLTRTTIQLTFKNCDNKTIFTGNKGTSKLKDYKKSYHEAIRNAFTSLDKFSYNYSPQKEEVEIVVKNKQPKIKVIQEVKSKAKVTTKPIIKQKIEKSVIVLPKKEKKVKTQAIKTKLLKPKTTKQNAIVGLYMYKDSAYEISAFQNYFIFVKRELKGNSIKSTPLGFIYNTSRKGNYLVKTTSTFTGYLKSNGDFVVDKISEEGTINSVTYIKTKS